MIGGTVIGDWLDARDVVHASAGHGLALVVAAGGVLALAAILRGVQLVRERH